LFLGTIVAALRSGYLAREVSAGPFAPQLPSSDLHYKSKRVVRSTVKKLLYAIVFSLLGVLPAIAATSTPLRVNCGGSGYTDSKGQVWEADFGFTGGSAAKATNVITGTPDPALFQSSRDDANGYSFSIANGTYQVNLYFAETNVQGEEIGGRVFSVSIEGTDVFPNLDVFSEVGANTALIKTTTATVSNGKLTISFANDSGLDSMISAIEVLPANQMISGPSLTLSFKYPDGTPVAGTLNYAVRSSLLSFHGAEGLVNGFAECDLFANPSAMGISAEFTVTLSLTDTSGNTLWQMNLQMNPAQVNLGAVQSSALSVVVQKM
jgi:Malectin domain